MLQHASNKQDFCFLPVTVDDSLLQWLLGDRAPLLPIDSSFEVRLSFLFYVFLLEFLLVKTLLSNPVIQSVSSKGETK